MSIAVHFGIPCPGVLVPGGRYFCTFNALWPTSAPSALRPNPLAHRTQGAPVLCQYWSRARAFRLKTYRARSASLVPSSAIGLPLHPWPQVEEGRSASSRSEATCAGRYPQEIGGSSRRLRRRVHRIVRLLCCLLRNSRNLSHGCRLLHSTSSASVKLCAIMLFPRKAISFNPRSCVLLSDSEEAFQSIAVIGLRGSLFPAVVDILLCLRRLQPKGHSVSTRVPDWMPTITPSCARSLRTVLGQSHRRTCCCCSSEPEVHS